MMKVRSEGVCAAGNSHIWLCHTVTQWKKMRNGGEKYSKSDAHSTVIYLYIPAIPQYRYVVCHGVLKSTTIPIPMLPALKNPWVFLYPYLTLGPKPDNWVRPGTSSHSREGFNYPF